VSLRKREEVQEMLRAVAGLILAALPSQAAIWPEQWWEFKRSGLEKISPEDRLVWEEYGLQEAESARYSDGGMSFAVSGWRLRDTTSAFAVAQWKLTPEYRKAKFEDTAWQSGRKYLWIFGNYVFQLEGDLPDEEKRQILYIQLPRLERSALPKLTDYLPMEGLEAGSRRYVLGPVSLEKFEPRIPPSIAAFHLGAEGQLGRFQMDGFRYTMLIFSYPTPNIAKKQFEEFLKLNGVMAKRTGPMVALAIGATNQDAAERALAKVNYQATISWSEPVGGRPEPNMGDLILGAVKLIGFLCLLTVVGGGLIAGIKMAGQRWLGWSKDDEAMLTLHIDDHTR
jgi:hypothetical protein